MPPPVGDRSSLGRLERALGTRILPYLLDPTPHRTLAKRWIQRYGLGTLEWRIRLGAIERPHYAYCVWNAAVLARRLSVDRISVIEFGVAGGNGLLALERLAKTISGTVGVAIDVYGFDNGTGLPAPNDYRDLPYHWQPGFFEMDVGALQRRLVSAKLVLGDIGETLPTFTEAYGPAPVGAVMQDLDYYSSTVSALGIFEIDEANRMPRIFTYFDDIIGDDVSLYCDETGERLAIREFNEAHPTQCISPAYHLLGQRIVEPWYHQIFVTHDFAHSRYGDFVSRDEQQLPLAKGPGQTADGAAPAVRR